MCSSVPLVAVPQNPASQDGHPRVVPAQVRGRGLRRPQGTLRIGPLRIPPQPLGAGRAHQEGPVDPGTANSLVWAAKDTLRKHTDVADIPAPHTTEAEPSIRDQSSWRISQGVPLPSVCKNHYQMNMSGLSGRLAPPAVNADPNDRHSINSHKNKPSH